MHNDISQVNAFYVEKRRKLSKSTEINFVLERKSTLKL